MRSGRSRRWPAGPPQRSLSDNAERDPGHGPREGDIGSDGPQFAVEVLAGGA